LLEELLKQLAPMANSMKSMTERAPSEPSSYNKVDIPSSYGPDQAVHFIDALLYDKFQNNKYGHSVTKEERDALRHYYGMRELVNAYGPGMAEMMGNIHEWSLLDIISPIYKPDDGREIQREVDYYNNAIALDHKERGVGQDFHNDLNMDSLRNVLKPLRIPPPYKK
jgi:hypothetical protein